MKRVSIIILLALSGHGIACGQSVADSLLSTAVAQYRTGNHEIAHRLFIELETVYNKSGGNTAKLTELYRLIGENYRASQEFDLAVNALEKSLELANGSKDSLGICRANDRLAAVYYEMKDLNRAEETAEQVVKVARRNKYHAILPQTLNLLGAMRRDRGDFSAASGFFEEAIQAALANQDSSDIPNFLNNQAQTLLMQKKYQEAYGIAEQAARIAKKNNVKTYVYYAYQVMIESLEKMGRFEEAIDVIRASNRYRDSLFNESKTRQIHEINAQNAMDLEKARNADLAQQNDFQKARNRFQLIVIILISVSLLVAFSALYLMIRQQKRLNRANQLLKEKNREVERQKSEIVTIAENLRQTHEELELKNKVLESSNKMKDKLFSIISHDLRSPLNSLKGILSLVRSGGVTEEEMQKLSQAMVERVEFTSSLLENLLSWSRSQMEGFVVKTQNIDLYQITERVINQLNAAAEKKHIQILNQVKPHLLAFADPDMMEIVVRNLVSNALKFTPSSGRVEIAAYANGKAVNFSVKDSGIGIKPENLQKLFGDESFSTLGTANEKGSGLGLVLCKDFIEKNGGSLVARSEAGMGSTFSFSVPLAH